MRLMPRFAIVMLACMPAACALGQPEQVGIDVFLAAASFDGDEAEAARMQIAAGWRGGYAAMIVDLLDLVRRTRAMNPGTFAGPRRLTRFLEAQTGQDFGNDMDAWRQWVWGLPYEPHPDYAEFKGRLYSQLDERFAVFFRERPRATIRLDEIQWGGVAVNGIPPLRNIEHLQASEAGYLDDDNIVFGISINGQSRAYPKRILAWHELALDRVGDRDLAVVYCTLCGTVIPFEAQVDGRSFTFGTSGLLYRSNKLMFDHETASLWSSLTGEPVVGPLVGSGLILTPLPVVTTTWGQWRARHPDTTVLSLQTGYDRDYSEGAAYRAYFSTDELMFDVALRDGRLANKAEVLVVRDADPSDGITHNVTPLAISAELLVEQPVFHFAVDGVDMVVITSAAGANRVYASSPYRFTEQTGTGFVLDSDGRQWRATENSLDASFDAQLRLPRIAAHRAFWFGWYAQHPDTELIR